MLSGTLGRGRMGPLSPLWGTGRCGPVPIPSSAQNQGHTRSLASISGRILGPMHAPRGPNASVGLWSWVSAAPVRAQTHCRAQLPDVLLFHLFLLRDKDSWLKAAFSLAGWCNHLSNPQSSRLHQGQEMASPEHLPEQSPWRSFASIPCSSRTEDFPMSKTHGWWSAELRVPLHPRFPGPQRGPGLAAQQHLH